MDVHRCAAGAVDGLNLWIRSGGFVDTLFHGIFDCFLSIFMFLLLYF